VVLLLTRTIDLSHTIEFMSVDVIIFLVGMMVLVGLLRRSGFFRWLLAKALKISGFEPNRLMLILLAMSSVMAAIFILSPVQSDIVPLLHPLRVSCPQDALKGQG
jgi:Na+/H+ antiporter NhaD/arsenite permease-like protein